MALTRLLALTRSLSGRHCTPPCRVLPSARGALLLRPQNRPLGVSAAVSAGRRGAEHIKKLASVGSRGLKTTALSSGADCLWRASAAGDAARVRELLEQHGAAATPGSLDSRDPDLGRTALTCAAAAGHAEVLSLLLSENSTPEIIEARDNTGVTALMAAAMGGHEDAVGVLIEHGAATESLPEVVHDLVLFEGATVDNGGMSGPVRSRSHRSSVQQGAARALPACRSYAAPDVWS